MKKIFQKIVLTTIALAPSVSLAAVNCESLTRDTVSGILKWASCVLSQQVMPFLMILAVSAFIFGIIKFFLNPNNEKEKEGGKKFMINGLIALFIMVSFWGILRIFITTFQIDTVPVDLPTIRLEGFLE